LAIDCIVKMEIKLIRLIINLILDGARNMMNGWAFILQESRNWILRLKLLKQGYTRCSLTKKSLMILMIIW